MMRGVLFIFVLCMIAKDVVFAPFPNVLRGFAQTLCFAMGLVALRPILSTRLLVCYWPLLGYLSVLLLTAPFTPFPLFVSLQVLSLASAVVFAIAYFERQRAAGRTALNKFVLYTVLAYGIVAYTSLALAKLHPGLAYDSLFAGDETGYEVRFRGMFGKSAMMAAASGLLAGLAAFGLTKWSLKLVLIVPGLLCLALTQSRTFWVACLAAGGVTAWLYYPRLRSWIYAYFIVTTLVVATSIAFDITVNTSELSSLARVDSVGHLTGRTSLWQTAFNSWTERPWLGRGFTLGGSVLGDDRSLATVTDPSQVSRQTLHNGYLQSLMDTGLIGFFFYGMAILISIGRVIRYDSRRRFPEVLYVLLFSTIANCGESVVYSGSVFQSLCFWVFAVFAMGLLPYGKGSENAEQTAAPPAAPHAGHPVQNLMP
jgi:O-antigen ligase